MSQEQPELTREQSNEGEEREQDGQRAERLTSVSEAIRYRKRAQAAEERAAGLEAELAEQAGARQAAEARLTAVETDMALTQGLLGAGVKDLEVGLLLAHKRRAAAGEKPDVEALVTELRRERPEMFAAGQSADGGPTAGLRAVERAGVGQLQRLAQTAAQTGDRRDVQAYLRQRRATR